MEVAVTGFWSPGIESKNCGNKLYQFILFFFLSGVRKDEFSFCDLVRLSALAGRSKI